MSNMPNITDQEIETVISVCLFVFSTWFFFLSPGPTVTMTQNVVGLNNRR